MSILKRRLFQIVRAGLALLLGSGAVAAQEFEKNILTGGPTGTYIQIGRDISNLVDQCGQTLNVVESAGSLENFLGVRQRRATQFGIVQSDVLEYLKTYSASDQNIARAIAGVRIAFPLYNEEVHLLATRDIATPADLAGKRVAIGVQDSGTFLTASLFLDLLEVDAGELLTIGPDAAMAQLLAGEIDAFFYVAGAPTRLFSETEIDANRFHLVPVDDPLLEAVYLPSEIPAGTYAFQAEPVPVVAVKAVLMTYEYIPQRNAYHRASCTAVSDVSNLILNGFAELQASGHPKWQQVDLNDIPPGWDVSSCVNDGLVATYQPNCTRARPAMTSPESAANEAYRNRICAVIGC
ncbi:TAXI family TRAP transporter solute-binding subunit [Dinoroseobacter sp. PD6]|uniref:TAXI family TRAP transporter solute-binding subunit n=1 Tax=Dinoroseobacter sp. PD6 TaxID=3028384 RepID=UPI00237A1DBC|nr:TAXI family TRAP transporter solute-binding subunit [Dinoroseobacter sp. PD6]MDD9715237.1 TAXI family TRAP transporter solute-binding subunit [Dinoroseobacter sp. PD6]